MLECLSIPEFVPTAGKSGLCSSCLTVGLTVLRVSQSATRPPSAMAGYESAFQAIDETIADCCLRELPWEFSANIWRADPTSNARCALPKTLSLCRLVISFQLLNTLCSKFSLTSVSTKLLFHKTSFPPSVTEGKNALCLPSLALTVRKPRKRGLANFAKYSSVLNAEFPANPLITKY